MSLNDYLTACRKNDVLFVRANFQRYINQRETRPSHFLGFSGIHYAAYFGHVEIFAILLPYELHLKTEDIIYVVDEYDEVIQEIPNHTNVFTLAILANRIQILQELEGHFQENAGIFWQHWSDRKKTKNALRISNTNVKEYVEQTFMPLFKTLKNGTGKDGLLANFA